MELTESLKSEHFLTLVFTLVQTNIKKCVHLIGTMMGNTEQQDVDEIRTLVTDGYMDAVHSSDPSVYAALFTNDAIWMPPGSPLVNGRAAIEDAECLIFKAVSLQIVSKAIEAKASGDIGWAIGEIDGTKIPHDGSDSTPFYFRLLWVVRRENGNWKIDRQLWNSRPS